MGLSWQLGSMKLTLKMLGKKGITDITHADLRTVLEAHGRARVKATTVRGRMAVLCTVIYWCVERGLREAIRFPKLPGEDYEKVVPPTHEEIGAIIEAAPAHVQRVVILGSQCVMRVGPCELLGLTWEDVDLTRGALRVHGSHKNKAVPWREVPLRKSLLPVLAF